MYEHISRTLRVTPRAAASPPPCILGALLRKAPRMQGGGQQPPGGERYFVTIGDIPTGSPHRCRGWCSSPSLRSGRLACATRSRDAHGSHHGAPTLRAPSAPPRVGGAPRSPRPTPRGGRAVVACGSVFLLFALATRSGRLVVKLSFGRAVYFPCRRSEEHTSELQSR